MEILEWIGFGVLILLAALAVLFVRRALIARAGTIRLSLRVSTLLDGRGWSPGFGRFVGDELRCYRVFSFAIRPKNRQRRSPELARIRPRPPRPRHPRRRCSCGR